MVYMEPVALGYKCLFDSWYNTFPPSFKLSDKLTSKIIDYITKYVPILLDYVRRELVFPVETTDNNLCQSLCKILDCYFSSYIDREDHPIQKEEIDDFESTIDSLF